MTRILVRYYESIPRTFTLYSRIQSFTVFLVKLKMTTTVALCEVRPIITGSVVIIPHANAVIWFHVE